MTDLREGIREYLNYHFYSDKWHLPICDVDIATDEFLKLLDSVGVVTIDEGGLEYCLISMDKIAAAGKTAYIPVEELQKAGMQRTKPLI